MIKLCPRKSPTQFCVVVFACVLLNQVVLLLICCPHQKPDSIWSFLKSRLLEVLFTSREASLSVLLLFSNMFMQYHWENESKRMENEANEHFILKLQLWSCGNLSNCCVIFNPSVKIWHIYRVAKMDFREGIKKTLDCIFLYNLFLSSGVSRF